MRQARLSLKKLMLVAIILNFPILSYVFLSAYTEKREKVLNFHRKGITLSTRLRNTSIMVPGMDNRVILVQNAKNTTNSSNRTPLFDDLIDSWLPIDSTATAHYVFSAFLHKVGANPTIRVIGAMCQASLKAKIYCELRYLDNHGNESVVTVTGSVKQLPEGSGRKYRAGFFHCRLPDKRVPITVAVKTHPNATSLHVLPVRSQEANQSDRKQFTVCVSPLFGGYNSTTNMIQWIELTRLLGADLFVFYNFSIAKNIDALLQFYSGKGLVKVIPWDISKFRPPGKNQEISYAGQTVALNDCLMRVKPISKFVVNLDLDEVLVPHGDLTTWRDIVNKFPNAGVFNFRSSFFRLNWENTDKIFQRKEIAEKYKISFLLKLDHDVKIFPASDRTKYFAKTDIADSLLVHKVYEKFGSQKSEIFQPEVALVHHYRRIMAKINGVSQPDPSKGPKVFDGTVLRKYGDTVIQNVLKVHTQLYEQFS